MKARYSQSRCENESGISVSSDALLKARHASSRKTRVDVTEGEEKERRKKGREGEAKLAGTSVDGIARIRVFSPGDDVERAKYRAIGV